MFMGGAYDVIDLGQAGLSSSGGARFSGAVFSNVFFLLTLIKHIYVHVFNASPAAHTLSVLKLTLKWCGLIR